MIAVAPVPISVDTGWFDLKRYAKEEAVRVWAKSRKIDCWVRVERVGALCKGRMDLIPLPYGEQIHDFARCTVEEQEAGERAAGGQDLVGGMNAIRNNLRADGFDDAANFVHFNDTSYDKVETGLSLQLRDFIDLMIESLDSLSGALSVLARKHHDTKRIGRTHGAHAEPITFAFTVYNWLDDVLECIQDWKIIRNRICLVKFSGSVGVYKHPPALERMVAEELGLATPRIATQVLSISHRVRYANALALTARVMDRIATNVRLMSMSEVREAKEPPSGRAGQGTSSSMPHKDSAEKSERTSGLARVVSLTPLAFLESVPTWYERDLTASSVERMLLPMCSVLAHYLVWLTDQNVRGMQVNDERMLANLNMFGGAIYSQVLQTELKKGGMSAEDAFAIARDYALRAIAGEDFATMVHSDSRITEIISGETLYDMLNPERALRFMGDIYGRFEKPAST